MLRKAILCSVAALALIPAAAAAAKPGGGAAAPAKAAMPMKAPTAAASAHGATHPQGAASTPAASHSQGPAHASQQGLTHSSTRSVLKGGTVVGGNLAGLTVGMHVSDASGTMVGAVSKILTARDGRVVNVLVKSHTGSRTIPLKPSTLSVSGGMVTATRIPGHR
ncbi:MAG: hypothetical protein V4502_05645 [Pseudomonadota bacterium]